MAKYNWSFDPAVLIPGYGLYRSFKNVFTNFKNDGYQWSDWLGWYGAKQGDNIAASTQKQAENIISEVNSSSRQQFLADREHSEMREDTAYQRAAEDMRAAGLNPALQGISAATSTASNVGDNFINSKLQILGYLLDLQNISINNKKLLNNVIGTVIKAVM